jgi:urease accessory protein
VALGNTAGVLGWTAEATAVAFLYSTTSLLVGAALRLLPIGQTEGQRILWRLHPIIARVGGEAAARDAAALWSFAPGLDIQGMRHERLEMRLFRS